MTADGHRVALLHLGGQGEELAAGRAHRRGEVGVHTVPGDDDESGPLQPLVHLGGQRLGVRTAGIPTRNVYCRNRAHSATPMSSFHRSGRAAMNSSIIVTHR